MKGGQMGGYGYMMNSWTGAIAMGLVILILIGVLIYLLFKSSKTGGFGQTPNETPLDILKKRYARGEITKEQFEEMKEDL
jgi:putative membrane protein